MSLARAEKVALIERVREERPDLTGREKAALLGMSYSAYKNLIYDPDGSKQRARRESYVGECLRCGAETRSNGTSQASRLCVSCAQAEQMQWTPERIIAAIQAFHARHGRTPSSHEWLLGPEEGCPYTATVLNRFPKWADAIEAAGFPRPTVGGPYLIRERGTTVEYAVFRMNGSAELLGITDARSVVEAIGNLADTEGRYGAVSISQIQIRDVKQQLSVIRPAAQEPDPA